MSKISVMIKSKPKICKKKREKMATGEFLHEFPSKQSSMSSLDFKLAKANWCKK